MLPFSRGDKNPLLPSRPTTGCLGPSWRLAGFPFNTTVQSGTEGEELFASTEAEVRVQPRRVRHFPSGSHHNVYFSSLTQLSIEMRVDTTAEAALTSLIKECRLRRGNSRLVRCFPSICSSEKKSCFETSQKLLSLAHSDSG